MICTEVTSCEWPWRVVMHLLLSTLRSQSLIDLCDTILSISVSETGRTLARRWRTRHWNQTQALSSLETSARLEQGACVPPSSWFSPRMCHVRAPCVLPRAWPPATGHPFASFGTLQTAPVSSAAQTDQEAGGYIQELTGRHAFPTARCCLLALCLEAERPPGL